MPSDKTPGGTPGRDLIARGDAPGGHATSKHLDRPTADPNKGSAAKPGAKPTGGAAPKRSNFNAATLVRKSAQYRSAVQQLRPAPPGSFATIRIAVPDGNAPRPRAAAPAAATNGRAAAATTIFAKLVKNPKGLFFQTLVTEPTPTPGSPARPPGVKVTLARSHATSGSPAKR